MGQERPGDQNLRTTKRIDKKRVLSKIIETRPGTPKEPVRARPVKEQQR